jgi:SAM-dependent methyltransferase
MAATPKQRVVAAARAAGLAPALEVAKFLRAAAAAARDNAAFVKANPDFQPPPLWWMHDMYSHASYRLYDATGAATAQGLRGLIDAHVAKDGPDVADWGCGMGRVLRHLPDTYQLTGFDYNKAAVDWCAKRFPHVAFASNGLMPPLPTAPARFDALYALSVFTHLSAAAHEAWIEEIERVLRPGGVFIGAFHMVPPEGQLLDAERRRFDAGELVTRGGVAEGSRIYTAFHPEAYLRGQLFARFEIVEGPTDFFGQTAFVIRKPV